MGLETILVEGLDMKILVVAHNSYIDGGANRSLLMVLDILKEKYKVECTVLVPSKQGPFVDELDSRGIRWIQCKYYGCTSNIRHDKYDILRFGRITIGYLIEVLQAFRMSYKLKYEKFDLVYTNTRVICIGAKIARRLSIPHICHVREFGSIRPLWGFWGYKPLYKSSKKIILISNALKQKFMQYVNEDKLVTIHNGIDSDIGLDIEFEKDKTTFDILLTGRLDPEKGHIDALKAIKLLKNMGYSNLRLHIAGSESNTAHISWYKDSLIKFVEENNLEKEVIMHGEVSDMRLLRRGMDIELMCAICETFGRVTVEGMRNGLCLIGSDTGGTPEIIYHLKNGLLYKQGDYNDLAQKIKMVIDDKKMRLTLARNGYAFSQVNFTPEKNVDSIYEILKESCEKR